MRGFSQKPFKFNLRDMLYPSNSSQATRRTDYIDRRQSLKSEVENLLTEEQRSFYFRKVKLCYNQENDLELSKDSQKSPGKLIESREFKLETIRNNLIESESPEKIRRKARFKINEGKIYKGKNFARKKKFKIFVHEKSKSLENKGIRGLNKLLNKYGLPKKRPQCIIRSKKPKITENKVLKELVTIMLNKKQKGTRLENHSPLTVNKVRWKLKRKPEQAIVEFADSTSEEGNLEFL